MSDDELPERGPFTSEAPPARPRPERRSLSQLLMQLAIGVPAVWSKRPTYLRSFEEARKVSVNVFVLSTLVVVSVLIWKATFVDAVVVEPISLPKALEASGYSPNILSQRLLDQVREIGVAAKTTKQRAQIESDNQLSALAAIQLPTTAFSLKALVAALRELLGIHDKRIAGEVILTNHSGVNRYSLMLRMDTPRGRRVRTVEAEEIGEVLNLGARGVVEFFDPYVLAAYLHSIEKWEECGELAHRIALTEDRHTAKWANNLIGILMKREGRFDLAITFYRRALENDPLFHLPYLNMARALAEQEKFDEAIKQIEIADTLTPKNADILLTWGLILIDQKKSDEAAKKYRAALHVDPTGEDIILGYAIALNRLNDVNGALEQCNLAIRLNRRNARAHFNCAVYYNNSQDYAQAVLMYQKAAELEPKVARTYRQLGEVQIRIKDYAGAIGNYRKAAALEPQDHQIRLALARVFATTKDYDAAIESFREAMKIHNNQEFEKDVKSLAMYRDRGAVP